METQIKNVQVKTLFFEQIKHFNLFKNNFL